LMWLEAFGLRPMSDVEILGYMVLYAYAALGLGHYLRRFWVRVTRM